MAQYLMKFKGKYRLLPELCLDTNDFPRNAQGGIDEDAGIYIKCSYGNKISYWGLNDSKRGVLIAYIPSVKRGRNIKKDLKKQGIDIIDYDESDEEVMFKFLASDIEPVANLMKASTYGAKTSPFSTKNLPKEKVDIPEEEMERYKSLISKLDKSQISYIAKMNNVFLDDVLAKKLRPPRKRKKFDYKSDMRQMKLSRDAKGYIYKKGLFEDYLEYLEKEIDYYLNK